MASVDRNCRMRCLTIQTAIPRLTSECPPERLIRLEGLSVSFWWASSTEQCAIYCLGRFTIAPNFIGLPSISTKALRNSLFLSFFAIFFEYRASPFTDSCPALCCADQPTRFKAERSSIRFPISAASAEPIWQSQVSSGATSQQPRSGSSRGNTQPSIAFKIGLCFVESKGEI